MKHLFIVNPAAGKPKAADRAIAHIRAAAKRCALDAELFITERPGDATARTRAAAERGLPTRIYACGGDGTLWEVVQGAAGVGHLAVTNLPTGTGNDFLKLFGPDYRAQFSDVAALCEGPVEEVDLIDCNGTLGLNTVCVGLDARVAADVARFKRLPLVRGMGAYALSLVNNVLFRGLGEPMRVSMDGRSWDENISILCVCNGRYYGGGFMPVGEAMPDDGVLDALLVPQIGPVQFVRLIGDYSHGKYADHPDAVIPYHGAGPIRFQADHPLTAVVDGEVLRDTAFTVSLSDKTLRFFHPQGASWQKIPSISTKAAAGIC